MFAYQQGIEALFNRRALLHERYSDDYNHFDK